MRFYLGTLRSSDPESTLLGFDPLRTRLNLDSQTGYRRLTVL